MCEGCYERYEHPAIVSERTRAAAVLIARVFELHGTGGNLHVEIDDWNLDDEFFVEFKPWMVKEDMRQGQAEAEMACFLALKEMSLDERVSAMALHDGYLDETGNIVV